jgi:hypothetical protein
MIVIKIGSLANVKNCLEYFLQFLASPGSEYCVITQLSEMKCTHRNEEFHGHLYFNVTFSSIIQLNHKHWTGLIRKLIVFNFSITFLIFDKRFRKSLEALSEKRFVSSLNF